MKAIQPLLVFVGKFFLLYIAFVTIVNVTTFSKVYRDIYIDISSVVYNNVYNNALITCDKLEEDADGDDIVFTFGNKNDIEKAKEEARQTGQVKTKVAGFKWSFNSYRVDLMFLLFLVALILAYTTGWKRKTIGLVLGLVIYYAVSFLLLAGRLLFQIHQNQTIFPEYKLSAFGEQVISTSVNMHTEAMFFIMLLIWGVVMVRRNDFNQLKGN